MARLLILSQTYPPDPAAVGQYMADIACEMVRRGHSVTVITSARGYEDPGSRYPGREIRDGVDVIRVGAASFGKRTLLHRVAGVAGFSGQAWWRALWTPADGLLFSTSPPLIGAVARLVGALRRKPTAFWAMDLNPDQLIALGKLRPDSIAARVLEWANRFALRGPAVVIALDRFMERRLSARGAIRGRTVVLPPWSLEEAEAAGRQTATGSSFRAAHGLGGAFVVMYSGNHSPSNPLMTLVEAALALRDDPGIRFVFVGGGLGKAEVERYRRDHALQNVVSLPYQPRTALAESLAAADVHVVTLGDPMVGIVHPCKVYGAMAAGRTVLYFGPAESHIGDLTAAGAGVGIRVAHGDVAGAVAAIRNLRDRGATERRQAEGAARAIMAERFSSARLRSELGDLIEESLGFGPPVCGRPPRLHQLRVSRLPDPQRRGAQAADHA